MVKKDKKSPQKEKKAEDLHGICTSLLDLSEKQWKALVGLGSEMAKMTTAIESLKEKPYELKENDESSTVTSPKEKETVASRPPEMTQPIPMEYRMLVNDILNKDFGIKIEYMKDRPEFMFTIVVPEQYSPMSNKEKDMYKIDLRSKVIPYADGINGVRTWVELIYKNFNPEVQAQITADRH